MKRILLYLYLFLMVMSCSENEPMSYENNPAIYLPEKEVNYSFFYDTKGLNETTVLVTVHAMGKPVDVDRPFVLKQLNIGETNAAIAGTHFLPFESDEMKQRMVIPAGQNQVDVQVTLYKDPSLQLATVKLAIGCVENENFSIGVIEMQKTLVTFSSQAIKPDNWDDWYYAFGASWGSEKMRFIIDYTGITDFDSVPEDGDYLLYLNSKLNQKLFEYNSTHPGKPLAEADGTLINFDNPYRP